ncbi:multiple epidermal growth factor-like domains protein 11 isoform X2 [Saccostrea cucullata]|uniref:multiple epidermal growth factor-like domains protein 11 isoform X2 n=1 Tax=Saccostrea cuccullata TaxID=36930 RepID=UPI002ED21551
MNVFPILVILGELLNCYGYDNLSQNKKAAQSSTWPCGKSCSLYRAENAVDDDIGTCSRSEVFGHNSPIKSAWWYVDLGETESIYRINILYRDYTGYVQRQRGRMAGFSLFISNSTQKQDGHLCYKDKNGLPPLNFSIICSGHGRYIIFYNERFDGVTYPEGYESKTLIELCDVVIEGCESGRYGDNCRLNCPIKCPDHMCDIESGDCLTCLAGWQGPKCQEGCKNRTYGPRCMYRCGHCFNDAPCDVETGSCGSECDPGYRGDLCKQACENGSYGPSCNFTCGHCFNGELCDKTTGVCSTGCVPGYFGDRCHKECLPGLFGKNCSYPCSGHCSHNESCHHVDGRCKRGCAAGYIGNKCNLVCEPGFYGINCTEICSVGCQDNCNHVDGFCRCTAGWTGFPKCTIECPPNFFGIDCRRRCSGHCSNNDTCSRHDGTCEGGCQEPFIGRLCDHQRMTVSLTSNLFAIFIIIFEIRHCQLKAKANKRPEKYITMTDSGTLNNEGAAHQYEEIINPIN